MMNLANKFADAAQQNAEKTAVYWGERTYSYGELSSQSCFLAGVLRQKYNVRPGDRVGLWLKNCPEFITALLGILQAGAVVVPINNFLKPAEVGFILEDAGIDTLITDTELGGHFSALLLLRPVLALLNAEAVLASYPAPPAGVNFETETIHNPNRQETDLAVLIYTSGTTGRPKGAMLSHANLLHNVESCRLCLHTLAEDRFAVLLPLFHSYMVTVGILLPLLVGASLVLVKSLHPPRNALQEIFARRATVLPAIPPFFRHLVQADVPVPLPLRFCISGSAPLPLPLLQAFEKKFGIPLIEGFGLSEASPVVTFNPLDGTCKAGSVGLPIPNVEVSVQDETGALLGPDATGEICVRGGNVMLGYWHQPDETAKAFRHGWLLTGDIGCRDADGYYYITDRKKDMLLVNGINVYPREIEEVIHQFPNVKEAAVVGRPDTRRGEIPVAFVVANEGAALDAEALRQFIRSQLADYKVPKQIVLLPALPRNATGKILKTELRKQTAE